jgi:hypothetical protein
MNCKEWKTLFEQCERLEAQPELQKHADSCPQCRALLNAETAVQSGFTVLKKSAPTVDVSKKIMARIAREKPASAPNPIWEFLQNYLLPGNPVSSTVFYGLAGVIIFVLCQTIIFKAQDLKKIGPVAKPLWLISSNKTPLPDTLRAYAVTPQTDPQIAALPASFAQPIESAVPLTFTQESGVSVTLNQGTVIPQADGMKLLNGHVDVAVAPRTGLPAFRIETPLGLVTVIGTEFSVQVSTRELSVKVIKGKVQVSAEGRETFLTANQEKTFAKKPPVPTGQPTPTPSATNSHHEPPPSFE